MSKDKIQTKLKVSWNKKENCFGWEFPCRQGNFLGYEIAKFMQELIKKNMYDDFDLKTFECTVKITKSKLEEMKSE